MYDQIDAHHLASVERKKCPGFGRRITSIPNRQFKKKSGSFLITFLNWHFNKLIITTALRAGCMLLLEDR